MKRRVCAAVAMSMLTSVAHAGDWRLVTINNAGAFGIDFGSVRTEARGISAWVLAVNPVSDSDGVGYSLIRTLFDCDRDESAFTTIVEYAEDGTSLGSVSGRIAWMPLVPDSVGYANMRAACFNEAYGDKGWDNPSAFVAAYRQVQN
ncbi:surface-adhesin E family protein [Brevundimonas guildfordensis]|uniref:Surface-adhesin protein E-like domain-containing protein n=1 Tax=Brevundimonas guildfordensis TaxID=2762241 RepID=A0ABR8R3Y2_9CAUL|nr:surface-adhesin E family protein [Brevundimonas guildfordensis]MBD7942490.1 hypothetical protein [Brevundimonas guildfordensis]